MQAQSIIFPAQILRGPGTLSRLGEVCGKLGRRALLIGGRQALAAVDAAVKTQLAAGPVTLVDSAWFGGECSATHIHRLTQRVTELGIDLIIGAGGGKALDTCKAVGVAAAVPVVAVPTIAATCAAVTPLSIRYFDDGRFQDLYPLPQAPAAVIIDSDLLARAPMRWLAAGLGDTLAKWYEFRAISAQQTRLIGIQRSSQANSLICYDLIAAYGPAACQAVRDGRANTELDQVLDAIFMFAGLTSLMSNGAHAAAAHAIYEGFTVCHKTRDFGHGLLVGFGNLCLLALENRCDDELRAAITLAQACAVPLRLNEIAELTAEELDSIVRASVHAPDMANMPGKVTAADLYAAIRRVEAMAETIGQPGGL
ncbi:iron-containing alcohol dehydrogenase family protein [Sodalis sp. C49]|uniref:iron-containing alcohol dehydrogenase family protein n=1 Tax=Sodalis sp. C49 TaxID=3228929 RepID=UPI003965D21B